MPTNVVGAAVTQSKAERQRRCRERVLHREYNEPAWLRTHGRSVGEFSSLVPQLVPRWWPTLLEGCDLNSRTDRCLPRGPDPLRPDIQRPLTNPEGQFCGGGRRV